MSTAGAPEASAARRDPSAVLAQHARLEAIKGTGILSVGRDAALDRVAELAARLLGTPVAQVNVVTADAQVPRAWSADRARTDPAEWGVPVGLDASYCQYVVADAAPFGVADARRHPLVADSRATTEAGVVAYLGVPLPGPDGVVLGSVCVVDFVPREWTPEDAAALAQLAALAADALALRTGVRAAEADAAIRAQHALLQAVLDSTDDLVFAKDPDGRYLVINEAGARVHGRPAAEIVGRTDDEIFPPALAAELRANDRRVLEGGASIRVEESTVVAGERRVFQSTKSVFRDAAGRAAGVVGVATDVTARAAAADREARLQRVTAALATSTTVPEVAEALLRHTLAGSRRHVVATRQPAEGAAGGEYLQVVAADLPPAVRADWARFPLTAAVPLAEATRTGIALFFSHRADVQARYPAMTSAYAHMDGGALAVVPLMAGGAAVGAMSLSYPDGHAFTAEERDHWAALAVVAAHALERARLFEAERAARERAEGASRAKSEFLAVMSHELRTPLNAIQGHVQLIEMGLHGPVTDEQRAALARVARAERHLLGLINDVLLYAKLDAGRLEYDVRAVRPADALADAGPLVAPQFAAKRITFAAPLPVDGQDAAALLVWADREKLTQVLVNLLANAAKFTPDGGRVTVTAEAPADAPAVVCLHVTDTGPGIPGDQQARIFEPFVQAAEGRTRSHEGTGLGLSISRDLARGMGGDIAVRSAPGAGATFTVTLRRVVTADGVPTERRLVNERRDEERRAAVDRRYAAGDAAADPGGARAAADAGGVRGA